MKIPIITNLSGCFSLRNGVQMPYLGLGTYQADNYLALESSKGRSDYSKIGTNK